MRNIEFITSGMLTTIQDKGRASLQHLGIPASGAMDPVSMDMANLLVGNVNDEAVLECTYSGPKIKFHTNTLIAITGATVLSKLNGYNVENYITIEVQEGDILDLSVFESGMRAYIAFAGGINVPRVLDSRSTYLPMQFGEYDKKINRGHTLSIGKLSEKRFYKINEDSDLRYSKSEIVKLRVVKGPQFDYFGKEEVQKLVKDIYTISEKSDRMGLRLLGYEINTDKEDMISDGIPLGSIQITRGGQPIIMAADRQPTGGYPKIAKIINCDVYHIGQLSPGDKIKLEWVSIEDSKRIYLEKKKQINNLVENYCKRKTSTNTYRMYINDKMFQTTLVELKS